MKTGDERAWDLAHRRINGNLYACAAHLLGSGPDAGLGAQLGALSLDYAWMPLGELGQVQRMQLGWRFNTAPAAAD